MVLTNKEKTMKKETRKKKKETCIRLDWPGRDRLTSFFLHKYSNGSSVQLKLIYTFRIRHILDRHMSQLLN